MICFQILTKINDIFFSYVFLFFLYQWTMLHILMFPITVKTKPIIIIFKDCDASISLDPGFVKAYLRKANVLKAMGQTQKAMDVYSKAMELDPNSDEAKNGRTFYL